MSDISISVIMSLISQTDLAGVFRSSSQILCMEFKFQGKRRDSKKRVDQSVELFNVVL